MLRQVMQGYVKLNAEKKGINRNTQLDYRVQKSLYINAQRSSEPAARSVSPMLSLQSRCMLSALREICLKRSTNNQRITAFTEV